MEQFIVNTKIYMGKNALSYIRDLQIQKACIICDPFMQKSGKDAELAALLEQDNIQYMLFCDVVPDPTIAVVIEGVKHIMDFNPDSIIALGGGSAIDTAKAVSYIFSQMPGKSKPQFVSIPTTSGTGSEVTSFSVISDPEMKVKYPLVDDQMLPDVALLDPNLTLSVPSHVTADTGMDVLIHAFEAYVSPEATDFSDAMAEKSVKLVFEYLLRAVKNGDDFEAREHLHNASCLSGIAFNHASLGLCHGMAHVLGANFHVPHGRSNAILLPHIVSFNSGIKEKGEFNARARYAALAQLVGVTSTNEIVAVNGLIRKIEKLLQDIGISPKLSNLNIDCKEFEQRLDDLAQDALADRCTATNPRTPTKDEVKTIYRSLLG